MTADETDLLNLLLSNKKPQYAGWETRFSNSVTTLDDGAMGSFLFSSDTNQTRPRYKSSQSPNTCFTIKTAFRFWQPYILTATVNCMNWIFGKRTSARYWLIRTNRNIQSIHFNRFLRTSIFRRPSGTQRSSENQPNHPIPYTRL